MLFSFWDTAHFKTRENFERSQWIIFCPKYSIKPKQSMKLFKKKGHRKGQFSSYFGNKTLIYTTFDKYLFKAYSENFLLQPFIPSFFYPTLPYMQPFSIFNSIIKENNLCRMEKIIIDSFFTLKLFMIVFCFVFVWTKHLCIISTNMKVEWKE